MLRSPRESRPYGASAGVLGADASVKGVAWGGRLAVCSELWQTPASLSQWLLPGDPCPEKNTFPA